MRCFLKDHKDQTEQRDSKSSETPTSSPLPVIYITDETGLTAPCPKSAAPVYNHLRLFTELPPHPVIYMSEILQRLELRAQAQDDAAQAAPVVDMRGLLKQLLTFPRLADGIVPDTWGTDKRADVKRMSTGVDSVYTLSRGHHSTRLS